MKIFVIFSAQYLYLFLLLIAFLYLLKQPRIIKKKIVSLGILSLPLTYLTAKLIAYFYYNPRPFVENNFLPLIPHSPDNGFPSDHTLLGAALAFLFYPFNKKISYLLLVFTFIIGLSRVYVGIHHFIDILASVLIAAGVTFFCFLLIKKYEKRKEKNK